MSKFISIEYTGTQTELINFLKQKDVQFEVKRIGDQKLFLKVPSAEELQVIEFFRSVEPLDEGSNLIISKVTEISESEYTSTVENGFELIHGENKLNSESNTRLISNKESTIETNPSVQQPLIRTNVETSVQPTISKLTHIEEPKRSQNLIQDQSEPRENVGMVLTNTNLPSKSPLQADDPFVFLTSSNYLKNFIVASTILLFVLTLFE